MIVYGEACSAYITIATLLNMNFLSPDTYTKIVEVCMMLNRRIKHQIVYYVMILRFKITVERKAIIYAA